MNAPPATDGPKPLWRRLYEGWLVIAASFGEVQTLIVVALVYGLVMGPMALAIRIGRGDPLRKRDLRSGGSAWLEADSVSSPDVERAKRLF
jgi:Saxitoxin biosynthesis operon protein SxtJ